MTVFIASRQPAYARRGNTMRLHGIDAELLDAAGVRKMAPFLNFDHARFPIMGGLLQRRGGTARHDAVAWGYARRASDRGVDIVQNCEITGFLRDAFGGSPSARVRQEGLRPDAQADRQRKPDWLSAGRCIESFKPQTLLGEFE